MVHVKKLYFPFPSNEIYICWVHSPCSRSSNEEGRLSSKHQLKEMSSYTSYLCPLVGDFTNEQVIIVGEWIVTFSRERGSKGNTETYRERAATQQFLMDRCECLDETWKLASTSGWGLQRTPSTETPFSLSAVLTGRKQSEIIFQNQTWDNSYFSDGR